MTNDSHESLARIFHEPNRLAIMSALCAAREGLAFTEIKEACRLTDGNLNRHLKTLEEAGAVRISKRFVRTTPRTTIQITRSGVNRFDEYLAALSEVLEQARRALPAASRRAPAPAGKPVAV
jgi:DNA-binding transcriptional ArsR family regulator